MYKDQCCNLIENRIKCILGSFSCPLHPEIVQSLFSEVPDRQKGEAKEKAQNATHIGHLNIEEVFELEAILFHLL